MSDTEPEIYKVIGGEGYRAFYEKTVDGLLTVIKLHMDNQGTVKKVYQSR